MVTTIVHVDALKLKTYTGNYSQFERERAEQLALQQASYAKQQRQIAHLQAFVDRFRAKATKAKQAQSRIKALERMERIAAAHVDSPFEFAFAPVTDAARQLVRLEHVTLGYGEAPPILADLDWGDPRRRPDRPARAQRRRQVDAAEGDRREARAARPASGTPRRRLRIGYFAQHQVEQLRAAESPLWHMAKARPGDARAGAARFPRRLRLPRRHGDARRWAASPAARRRASRSR